MTRTQPDQELRVRGMNLAARFALSMTVALALVMTLAGLLLMRTATTLAERAQDQVLADSVALSARELKQGNYEQSKSRRATETSNPRVMRFDVEYGLERGKHEPAYVYEARQEGAEGPRWLMVPPGYSATGRGLVGLIGGIILAVMFVGALVAWIVANRVSQPLEHIVDDIRQIARGELHHRSRVKGSAEIARLSRVVNRLAEDLEEAQQAEVELGVREREMEVADEVREALRPGEPPPREGYDLGALHIGASQPGGDFHDYIEYADGRLGLLVCGVSGQGVPGALVGATARAYLRSELAHTEHVADALRKVNRALALDVRRGMYVTAMYALLDPRDASVQVACAGHKVPLLRYTAADGKLRTLQPEGIALGFDKGPVFDRRLELQSLTLEPGDRLVLANTGPVTVTDEAGDELGERDFYRLVLGYAPRPSSEMLAEIEETLLEFAGEEPIPNDVSVVTVARLA